MYKLSSPQIICEFRYSGAWTTCYKDLWQYKELTISKTLLIIASRLPSLIAFVPGQNLIAAP